MFLFIIFIGLIVIYLLKDIERPTNFPPGPRWLPLIGNLPELKKLAKSLGGQHLALSELSRIYNTNVLGLKLGSDYVVVVFSYNTVRQVLTREEFEGRPDNFFIRLRCMGIRRGVTCTDGDLWSIQRNFVVRHLRNLGFGKKPMELMVKNEIESVLTTLQQDNIHIGKTLAPVVINILWMLITGNQLSTNHQQLDRLLDLFELRSKAFDMSGGTLTQYPWLRFVAPERSGYNLIQTINKQLDELFMETINEHQRNWNENRDDDLIYSYITEMKQNNCKEIFTYEQLVMVCLDLFIAGTQTTSNTLNFAFLMMILYPEIQEKVHQEIDQFLNGDNLTYSDRHKLPYTEAVLLEVERYCHVVPICGPRRVLRDTILEGYHIPKDTTVLISLYSVHKDQEHWKDPEVFRPDRFLDSTGKLLSPDRLIPFGLGRRRCLGEILAKTCIFMLFVEILRKFKITQKSIDRKPIEKPLPGITLSPQPYRAQFLERHSERIQ
uniref:Cytochrome P450 305a1 n=1 Tax=Mylabris cichorii TaxID=580878 RepID=A0A1W5KJU1_MYLCI|nr:cytochrome P450 305a1 [Mylabris cichorii]